jgi:hypothetical protein
VRGTGTNFPISLVLGIGFLVGAWYEHGVTCHNPPGTHCGTRSTSYTFAALGVVFLAVAARVAYSRTGRTRAGRLARTGKRAEAVVEQAADTGITLNLARLVTFVLRVEPDDGPPFEVRKRKLVSRIAVPRAGERVAIRYDPAKPEHFVFDETRPTSWH